MIEDIIDELINAYTETSQRLNELADTTPSALDRRNYLTEAIACVNKAIGLNELRIRIAKERDDIAGNEPF